MRPRGGLTPIVVNVSQETRVNGSGESKEYEHEKKFGTASGRDCPPPEVPSIHPFFDEEKNEETRRKRPSSPYAL